VSATSCARRRLIRGVRPTPSRPMFAVAQIIFTSAQRVSLESLKQFIEDRFPHKVVHAKWQLESYVVPQLLIHTTPPFTIQIESAEWVATEIGELPTHSDYNLPVSSTDKLLCCDARLGIMPVDDGHLVIEEPQGIWVAAVGTSLDPAIPHIGEVLRQLTVHLAGFLHDCVNGGVSDYSELE